MKPKRGGGGAASYHDAYQHQTWLPLGKINYIFHAFSAWNTESARIKVWNDTYVSSESPASQPLCYWILVLRLIESTIMYCWTDLRFLAVHSIGLNFKCKTRTTLCQLVTIWKITCGGPQGSIFGPLLFSIHTLPLAQIMDYYNILYHNSVNVTQLHPANDHSPLYLLSKCMNEINDWMYQKLSELM